MGREPFVWSGSGQKLTPKQLEERRKIAQALMARGADFSPAGHWTEALGRAFNGWWGGKQAGQFNRQEEEATAAARAKFEGRYSANPVAAALASGAYGGEGSGYVPPQRNQYSLGQDADTPLFAGEVTPDGLAMGADITTPDYIRQGLLARGLPEHIAEGFMLNFADESGFNPGINEISPSIPGSRGGFGLYQLTGPRRTAYESFAAERGVDPADVDAQLDWLMYELQGPEAKAAQSIFSAGNAGEAGAAIVNNFLRPAEEHRSSRASRYLGMSGQQPVSTGTSSQEIAALLADPWVAEQYGGILGAELQNAQQRENAIFQQQLAMQDPMYQLGLQKAGLELEQMRQPKLNEFDQRARVGQQFGLQGDALTNFALTGELGASVKPTGTIQEYEYYANGAIQRGETPMPFEQYQAVIARAGSGASDGVGTVPAGYRLIKDPLTGQVTGMEPIPGGPAELDSEKNKAALAAREQNAANAASIVLQDIDKAIEQTSGWTAGLGGAILGGVPGSAATDLRASMDTIRANIGFDRLQQMRDASPTGGALGGIAIQELQMLQAVLGSLDQSQSPEQLQANLKRLKEVYEPIAAKAAAYPNASQFGFGGGTTEAKEGEKKPVRKRYNPQTGALE